MNEMKRAKIPIGITLNADNDGNTVFIVLN